MSFRYVENHHLNFSNKLIIFSMKKVLTFIILSFLMLQNEVFATIQKAPENAVLLQKTKPHLSFKQKVFTYLIRRKMRLLNAKQHTLLVKKGNALEDCVTIRLKNGRSILATILSMDDKNITYKLCDHENTAEGIVRIEQVASVTDAQNRMIFNNQPKILKTGERTRGDKNATTSISALVIALGALILGIFFAFTALLDSLGNGGGENNAVLSIILGIIFFVGILVSFITGIMSLSDMASTPPQKESSKFLAILSTIISGLFVALMLLSIAGR